MKKNTLDMSLRKFKHVKSTPDATTLQHQDGHILTIAHKNLDPKTRAQLEALSKISGQDATPSQAEEQRDQKMAQGGRPCSCGGKGCMKCSGGMMAQGGPIQMAAKLAPLAAMMADGGDAGDSAWSQAKEFLMGPDFSDPKVNPDHLQVLSGAGPMAGIPGAIEALAPAAEEAGEAALSAGQKVGNTIFKPDTGFGKLVHAQGAPPPSGSGKIYGSMAEKLAAEAQTAAPKARSYGSGMAEGGPVRQMYADPQDYVGAPQGQIEDKPAESDFTPTEVAALPSSEKANTATVAVPEKDPSAVELEQILEQLSPGTKAKGGQYPAEVIAQAKQIQAQQQVTNNKGIQSGQTAAINTKANAAATGNTALADSITVPNTPTGNPILGGPANTPPKGPADLPDMSPDGIISNDLDTLNNARKQAQTGIMGQAAAQGAVSQESANAELEYQDATKQAQQFNQEAYQQLSQERIHLIKDIQDGYVDPEKYWTGDKDGNGSHSKLMAGIGMILAGFNPTNRPNAAIEFLNHQLDRNLDAQAKNLNAKHNLLAANLQQFGNLYQAAQMTRLQNADYVSSRLKQAADQNGGAMAKAIGQQTAANWDMQFVPVHQKLAFTQAMMKLEGQPGTPEQGLARAGVKQQYLRAMGDYAGAAEAAARTVPGIGASVTNAIPEDVRHSLIATKTLNDQINRAQEISEKYTPQAILSLATTNPKLAIQIRNEAETLQNNIANTIRQSGGEGVFKKSDMENILTRAGGNPFSFLSGISSHPKLKEMQTDKIMEYNNTLKGYGINGYPLQPYQSKQPQIKYKNGQAYTRGPNGEAIPAQRGKFQ